ncbi:sensor domain-containing diguanylate cyclase [Sulfurimonas lithotrophica]|uniref:diguanylate cyclase n=1 Tax=Sulfurimonas lithotrophica TaxID=2590022 RepID=A0A5P8P245_9BACT|nr:sensor domain-containing diguanylate cyclase [Sulfurimonas lithotrophica]QFR49677.1 sensor domain-containing diguanylate cyclase [Sulfurimonas lithotrophica]
MDYDFRGLFQEDETLFDQFIEKYTSYILSNITEEKEPMQMDCYKQIINIIQKDFNQKDMIELFEKLTRYQIHQEVPYIIIINEINSLQSLLIKHINESVLSSKIIDFFNLFNTIDDKVATIYLNEYVHKLKSVNNIRIASLSDLMDRNMLNHYESHLLWLSSLADSIYKEDEDNFPEVDPKKCDFGKWLQNDAKAIIQNNSKQTVIHNLHDNLHLFAKKIKNNIPLNEHHSIITYLEKCEMLSLSIGTELALIDNILMNHKVLKDHLTGALNRQSLKNIFKNQYELAVATSNPFVIAMCDLDHFKKLNDNHGHLCGDKILTHFVNVVNKKTRNSDIIIRFGGEEFVMILPAVDKNIANKVFKDICEEYYKTPFEYEGKKVQNSVSIGFVEITPRIHYKPSFLDDYLAMADQQLYRAKDNGRNRVCYLE